MPEIEEEQRHLNTNTSPLPCLENTTRVIARSGATKQSLFSTWENNDGFAPLAMICDLLRRQPYAAPAALALPTVSDRHRYDCNFLCLALRCRTTTSWVESRPSSRGRCRYTVLRMGLGLA